MRIAVLTTVLLSVVASFASSDAADKDQKMLRHVVLFKFKDDASKKQVKEVTDAFAKLPGKIDAI